MVNTARHRPSKLALHVSPSKDASLSYLLPTLLLGMGDVGMVIMLLKILSLFLRAPQSAFCPLRAEFWTRRNYSSHHQSTLSQVLTHTSTLSNPHLRSRSQSCDSFSWFALFSQPSLLSSLSPPPGHQDFSREVWRNGSHSFLKLNMPMSRSV